MQIYICSPTAFEMPKPSKKEKINQKQIRECICTFWEMGDFQKTIKSKNIKTNLNWREGTTILVLWLDASLSSHCSYQQQLGPESSRGLRRSLELHLRMTIFKPEWEIYAKKKKMLSFKIYPFFFFGLKYYLDDSTESSEKIHLRTKSTTAMAIRPQSIRVSNS